VAIGHVDQLWVKKQVIWLLLLLASFGYIFDVQLDCGLQRFKCSSCAAQAGCRGLCSIVEDDISFTTGPKE
jgi:hypothetical protein